MDDTRTVPATISGAQLEELFAGGTPAQSAETEKQLSAVSSQLSTDNPLRTERVFAGVPAATVRGRGHVPGEVPPSLRAFLDDECGGLTFPVDGDGRVRVELSPLDVAEMQAIDARDKRRDTLIAQLMFAARMLAEGDIRPGLSGDPKHCVRCGRDVSGPVASRGHGRLCASGRMLSILQGLVELAGAEAESGPDAADAADLGAAAAGSDFGEPWSVDRGLVVEEECFYLHTGDGVLALHEIYPQVYRRIAGCVNFFAGVDIRCIEEMNAKARQGKSAPAAAPAETAADLACLRCGQKDGAGWRLVSQQSHCNRVLASNECMMVGGGWCYIYAHDCAAQPGGAA